MSDNIFNELVDRNYLIVNQERVDVTKRSQKSGSPLDRFQTEILFFRHERKCSYNDIAKWLSTYHNIHRSHTQIATKIQQWENTHATKKILSAKKT